MIWLVLLFLEAQTFCQDKDLPQVPCIESYMLCVLDDNKDYCKNGGYLEFYDGK